MEPATKADFDALRADTKSDLDAFRNEMTERLDVLRDEMTEKMRGIETTVLREFRKWAVPMNTRMRVFEVSSQALTERISLAEERLDALETR